MKEFRKTKTVTYNLMSFTGFKALLLFSLLMEGPKSYNEISTAFMEHPYLQEKISKDTVRVYINSMRRIGCEIASENVDKSYKYRLVRSPYLIDITEIQSRGLSKVYKILSKTMSVDELVSLHEFFYKLRDNVKNPEVFDEVNKVSIVKGVKFEILKNLVNLVRDNQQVILSYASANSKGTSKDIEILLERFKIRNDKIYVEGIAKNFENKLSLLASRIKEIKEVKPLKDRDLTFNSTIIGYEYFGDLEDFELNENEVIKEALPDRVVIEVTSDNEFFTRQRILALADKARVIYPKEYRDQFIEWLKNMEAGYRLGK